MATEKMNNYVLKKNEKMFSYIIFFKLLILMTVEIIKTKGDWHLRRMTFSSMAFSSLLISIFLDNLSLRTLSEEEKRKHKNMFPIIKS